jgi:hypothetical protein
MCLAFAGLSKYRIYPDFLDLNDIVEKTFTITS